MRMTLMLAAAMMSTAANAAPLAMTCHQEITQQSFTGSGAPIPTQHLETMVGYVIDFDRRSLTVRSLGKTTTFHDGRGQHIIVDHEGMTIAGNSQLGANGPVTSQIMHFSADGTHGTGERKLLMRGRLLQKADTVMRCTPAS